MKFLIDNALSPNLAAALRAAGYDALHVRDGGLATAEDGAIFEAALAEQRIIVTADADFGALFMKHERPPSVILFRHGAPRRPSEQARLLVTNLPAIAEDLLQGAIVTFRRDRLRIRRLS